MPPVDPKDLSIKDLKSWLLDMTADHGEEIGPCLYWLRAKLKAQGARNDLKSKREGFGPWVEANLHITRKTADKWADAWAIEQGLMKPKTFSKSTKSSGGGSGAGDDLGGRTGPRIVYYNMTLKINEAEQEELIRAWETLGDDGATRLVYDTLVAAAKVASPKPPDSFKMDDLGELATVKVR